MSETVESLQADLAEDDFNLMEAESILTSVLINYEKREALTVIERELVVTITEWLNKRAKENEA